MHPLLPFPRRLVPLFHPSLPRFSTKLHQVPNPAGFFASVLANLLFRGARRSSLGPVVLLALGCGPRRSLVWASAFGFLASLPAVHYGIILPWDTLFRRLGAVCASAAGESLSQPSCSIIAGSFLATFRFLGLQDMFPPPPPAQGAPDSPSESSRSLVACSDPVLFVGFINVGFFERVLLLDASPAVLVSYGGLYGVGCGRPGTLFCC